MPTTESANNELTRASALQTLELDPTISDLNLIREQFCKLVKRSHPDKQQQENELLTVAELDEATEETKKLIQAYSYLKDNLAASDGLVSVPISILIRPKKLLKRQSQQAFKNFRISLENESTLLSSERQAIEANKARAEKPCKSARLPRNLTGGKLSPEEGRRLVVLRKKEEEMREYIQKLNASNTLEQLMKEIFSDKKVKAEMFAVLSEACGFSSKKVGDVSDEEVEHHAKQIVSSIGLSLGFCFLVHTFAKAEAKAEAKEFTELLLSSMKQVYVEAASDYSRQADPEGSSYLLSLMLFICSRSMGEGDLLIKPVIILNTHVRNRLRELNLTTAQMLTIKKYMVTKGAVRSYNVMAFSLILDLLPDFKQAVLAPLLQEEGFLGVDQLLECYQAMKGEDKRARGSCRVHLPIILPKDDITLELIGEALVSTAGFDAILDASQKTNLKHLRQTTSLRYWLENLRYFSHIAIQGYKFIRQHSDQITYSNFGTIQNNFSKLHRRQTVALHVLAHISLQTLIQEFENTPDLPLVFSPVKYAYAFFESHWEDPAKDYIDRLSSISGFENGCESTRVVGILNLIISAHGDFCHNCKELLDPKDQKKQGFSFKLNHIDGSHVGDRLLTPVIKIAGLTVSLLGYFVAPESWEAVPAPNSKNSQEKLTFLYFFKIYLDSISRSTSSWQVSNSLNALPDQKEFLKKTLKEIQSLSDQRIQLNKQADTALSRIEELTIKDITLLKNRPQAMQVSTLYECIEVLKKQLHDMDCRYVCAYFYCEENEIMLKTFLSFSLTELGEGGKYLLNRWLPERRACLETWFCGSELESWRYAPQVEIDPGKIRPAAWGTLFYYIRAMEEIHAIEKPDDILEKINKIETSVNKSRYQCFELDQKKLLDIHQDFRSTCEEQQKKLVASLNKLKSEQAELTQAIDRVNVSLEDYQKGLITKFKDLQSLEQAYKEIDRLMETTARQLEDLRNQHRLIATAATEIHWSASQMRLKSYHFFQQTTKCSKALQLNLTSEERDWDEIPNKIQEKISGFSSQLKKDLPKIKRDDFMLLAERERRERDFKKILAGVGSIKAVLSKQKSTVDRYQGKLQEMKKIRKGYADQEKLREKINKEIYQLIGIIEYYKTICEDTIVDYAGPRLGFVHMKEQLRACVAQLAALNKENTNEFSLLHEPEDRLALLVAKYSAIPVEEPENDLRLSTHCAHAVFQETLKQHRQHMEKLSKKLTDCIDTFIKDLTNRARQLFEDAQKQTKSFEALDKEIAELLGEYGHVEELIRWCKSAGVSTRYNADAMCSLYIDLDLCLRQSNLVKQQNILASVHARRTAEAKIVVHDPENISHAASPEGAVESSVARAEILNHPESQDEITKLLLQLEKCTETEQEFLDLLAQWEAMKDNIQNFEKTSPLQEKSVEDIKNQMQQYHCQLKNIKSQKSVLFNHLLQLVLALLKKEAPYLDEKMIDELNSALEEESPQISLSALKKKDTCLVEIHAKALITFELHKFTELSEHLRKALLFLTRQGLLETEQAVNSLIKTLTQRLDSFTAVPRPSEKYSDEYIRELTQLSALAGQIMGEIDRFNCCKNSIQAIEDIVQMTNLFNQNFQRYQLLFSQCSHFKENIAKFEEKFGYIAEHALHFCRMHIAETIFQVDKTREELKCMLERQQQLKRQQQCFPYTYGSSSFWYPLPGTNVSSVPENVVKFAANDWRGPEFTASK
jgi:hypothetical protein